MKYDIVVIGAGPAGYVSAIKASKLGAKVAIIEKDNYGGTCLNRGCIPTKDFLKNVEIIKNIKKAKKRGVIISNDDISIDIKKIVAHKNKTVKKLTAGVHMLLKANKVDIYEGEGKLVDANRVRICSNVSENLEVEGDKIFIATGSKVRRIPIKGIDSKYVYTSDSILDIEKIPEKMLIIGGGVIGCEFSQVFANFGTDVTIVEAMDRIVPMADEEVSQSLDKILKDDKIKIKSGLSVREIVEKDGFANVILSDDSKLEADCILLSIGRESNLEVVSDVDIKIENGKIVVDEYMRTSLENVYAIGDVNGLKMLAHAAFKMGEVAAENALKSTEKLVKCNLKNTPSAIYTLPEVAFIGISEEEAKKSIAIDNLRVAVGKFNFMANGRALASDEKTGFIKVVADKKYSEILGVHMVGPSVSEIINEASVFMENELSIEELLNSIHSHPSYSEVLYEALADTVNMAIHK